ncbi:hypothetical protein ACQEU8_01460 [Streptomyces sp. CA-250714]|uniref:hypothetical protein n=1 Tax=Streptomyces sp. CA-250714 TaxID=3240060 RepID=UPI003D8ABF68
MTWSPRHDLETSMTSPSAGLAATTHRPSAYAPLRRILAMDAAGMLVFGLAYLLASGPLARLLGVGDQLVLTAGGLMLTIGVYVAVLSSRAQPPTASVRLVIAIGAAWVAASVAAILLDWSDPNTIGTAWIALQAVPVSVFALLQRSALRRIST